MLNKNTFLIVVFALFFPKIGLAAPDVGAIQQQIERERESSNQIPKLNSVEKDKTQAVNKPLEGPTFIVKDFIFEGNTVLGGQQLLVALSSCLNKEIDFDRLKSCGVLVTEAYQEVGFVARAVIPPQDIVDGRVLVKVIEARFGEVTFIGTLPQRVQADQLLRVFDKYQKSGELLNMDRMDRALLLADDLPGVGVSGNLDQGKVDGLTNLVLQLADEPLVTGNASVDNFGSTSTGLNRINANLIVNSPLGVGDLLTANTMASQGTRFIRLEETMPLGSSGLRVGVNASNLKYELIDAQFLALEAKGRSQTVGLSADYPVIRTRQKNLNVSLNFDRKNYLNQANSLVASEFNIRSASIGVNGNIFDEFLGGGANFASVIWTAGYLDLEGSPNQTSDALTANTQGNFTKFRYSLSRQQKLTNELSAYINFTGQMTQRNLDSSEGFYLGGSTGVRAYPTSEGRGSQGQMLNLELRTQLPKGFNLVEFYDLGRVVTYPMNNFMGGANPNEISLSGYGIALSWQTNSGVTLKAVWSKRQGVNPNPSLSGTDQDGTLNINRFWLSAALTF